MFILWLLESERAVVVMAGGDGGQQRTCGFVCCPWSGEPRLAGADVTRDLGMTDHALLGRTRGGADIHVCTLGRYMYSM